jgi:hypothetical protein
MVHLYEAVCPKCGDTFNPDGPDDLAHDYDQNDRRCGGVADWYIEIHRDLGRMVVHTTFAGLQNALIERLVSTKKARASMPMIKFRPFPATPEGIPITDPRSRKARHRSMTP